MDEDPKPSVNPITTNENGDTTHSTVPESVGEVVLDEENDDEYDCAINNQFDQTLLFDLYQPIETDDFRLLCKICLQLGKQMIFDDKQQYASHRYKVHGSYNNSVACPILSCREVYASMIILRKHLMAEHKLPLETHHQIFANMNEFERWRQLVELASSCRYMMHTKQPHYKRQVMHCSRSEHKMVLQSKKHRLPRLRMMKEGSCCPAFISFRIEEKTGRVQTFYQLVHVGHATQDDSEDNSGDQAQNVFSSDNRGSSRLPPLHFPEKPTYLGERALQYLQIDLIEMDSTVYSTVIYANILIVTDLFTGYTWAKPIPGTVQKQLILRILTDIFCQFGVPEGYSCSASHSQRMIRDSMNSVADVFRVDIKEVFNEMPDYDWLRNTLISQSSEELKSPNRWVEVLPFTVMTMNQSGSRSSFERMFNRRPFGDGFPPWLTETDFIEEVDQFEGDYSHQISARYQIGDKVYLRNLNSRPGRGNTVPYLYGLIGDVDWKESPHFPYKVHYSKSSEPWPSEVNVFTWVTPYDVLPTTHDLMMIRDEDRRRVMSTLLCTCQDNSSKAQSQPCQLFRSHACSNGMARVCCLSSGYDCVYHELIRGEESYSKIQTISRFYSNQCTPLEKKKLGEMMRTRFAKAGSPHLESPIPSTVDEQTSDHIDVGTAHEGLPNIIRPAILRNRRRPARSASRIIVHTAETSPHGVYRETRPRVQIITDVEQPSSQSKRSGLKRRRISEQLSESGGTAYGSTEDISEDLKGEDNGDNQDQPEIILTRRSGRQVKVKTYDGYVTH